MRKPTAPPHFYEIDFLKGISCLTVILIHVLDKYRDISYVHTLWIILHFAVATFVISSGFLQQFKPLLVHDTKTTLLWLAKRIYRLVKPYYLYVLIHGIFILTLPGIFNRVDIEFTPRFIAETIFLIGGFSQNWIPRLFVLMTVCYLLYEIIRKALHKDEDFVLIPYAISLLISIVFMFLPFKIPSDITKFLQTLTWMSLFGGGMILFRIRSDKKVLFAIFLLSGILTLLLYCLLKGLGESTSIFAHEYPPTLYFISFGLWVTLGLYLLGSYIFTITSLSSILSRTFQFLSKHSYTIFFAHIIVMDIFNKPTGFWLSDFLIVVSVTLFAVFLFDMLIISLRKQWKR